MIRAFAFVAAALLPLMPASSQLKVTKPADLSAPVQLEQGQGAIVLSFRRPDKMSAGKSGALSFARYDVAARNTIYQPKDAKAKGDTTTYWVSVRSKNKKQSAEYLVFPVSAGDYVLFGASPGPGGQVVNNFCLGAPTFRVNASEVVYFGDLTPYMMVKMLDAPATAQGPAPVSPGSFLLGGLVKSMTAGRGSAMAYSSHPDEAKAALAGQPALASALKPAEIRNGATYGCLGQAMTAYQVPGAAELEAIAPASEAGPGD